MDKQPTPVSTGDLEAALEQTEQNKEAAQQLADIEKSWSADWDSHRYDRDEQQPHDVNLDCCGVYILDSGLCQVSQSVKPENHGNGKVCYLFPAGCCGFLICVYNLFVTPFLLVAHSINIYILPCFSIMVKRLICALCCCGLRFRDLSFPATDQSLGHAKGVRKLRRLPPPVCNCCCICFRVRCDCYDPCGGVIKWKHAADLDHVDKDKPMVLFHDGITGEDICQGGLGDCWMLAALACVAENNKDVIQSLFVTREADKCGCYAIRLYDMRVSRWRTFWVDDRVPVDEQGRTLFTSPNGNEMWVLLLEKAYAKMVGTYSGLVGGHPRWALEAFTGNAGVSFYLNGNEWSSNDLPKSYAKEKFFDVLDKCLEHKMLACAGSKNTGRKADDKANSKKGIVQGHAYTLLDCYKTPSGDHVVQLRNPWGSFEWTGAYSDEDHDYWHALDNAVLTLRGKKMAKEDGKFWMPWREFCNYFDNVDVCAATSSMKDLELDLNEDKGKVCGLVCGATKGCCSFWCPTGCRRHGECELQGCLGPRRMWFPINKSTKQILEENGV